MLRPATSRTASTAQQRRLGYWFYCTRPKPPEQDTAIPRPECQRDQPARRGHGDLARTQGQGDPGADARQCDGLYPVPARAARPRLAVQRRLAAGDLAGSRARLHAAAPRLDARQTPMAGRAEFRARHGHGAISRSATACSTSSRRAAAPARSCRRSSKASHRPGTSPCARSRPTAGPRGISRATPSRPTSAPAWGSSPRSRRRLCCGTPAKCRAIPIGYGVMSADELQDRIYLLTSKEAGRDY